MEFIGDKMKAWTLPANDVIEAVAKQLESNAEIKAPEWVNAVKTGSHAERTPDEEGFWFKRCASLLLSLSKRPSGVQRLRNKYGGRTTHTVGGHHHRKAGGKIIRLALQQLEKAGFIKKEKTGRTVSPAGISFMEKAVKAE